MLLNSVEISLGRGDAFRIGICNAGKRVYVRKNGLLVPLKSLISLILSLDVGTLQVLQKDQNRLYRILRSPDAGLGTKQIKKLRVDLLTTTVARADQ